MRNPRATLHDVVLDDDDGRGGTPGSAEPGVLAPLEGPVRELWTTSYYPLPASGDLGGVLVGVSFDMAEMAAVSKVVDDGSVPGVLFTAGAGLATAWDLGTGQRRWEVEGVADSAIVLDGVVYSIGSGIVSALDPMSGTELWRVRADLSGPYDLATDGSSLLILGRVSGSATSTVRAMNRTDGSTQWDAPLTHPMQSLEVSAGHLFAQTDQGVFVALG